MVVFPSDDSDLDTGVLVRLARIRKRDKWAGRRDFAERARIATIRAESDPQGWIEEILETEAILG